MESLRGAIPLAAVLLLASQPGAPQAASNAPLLNFNFKGPLGSSGLYVETTPQSVLITRVSNGSPASRAGIASGAAAGRQGQSPVVTRILVVNGRPIATLSRSDFLAAFFPASHSSAVTLVIGHRNPDDLDEARLGPIFLELASSERVRAFRLASTRQWGLALATAGSDGVLRADLISRLIFDARDRARSGQLQSALTLLALVRVDDPGYGTAVELIAELGYKRPRKAGK